MDSERREQLVFIPADKVTLEGALVVPAGAQGVVAFAHGSGSSRQSPRNTFVAQVLRSAGLGTLLFDLLTKEEDMTYETRFDIALLRAGSKPRPTGCASRHRPRGCALDTLARVRAPRRPCERQRRWEQPLGQGSRVADGLIWRGPRWSTYTPPPY